MSDLRVTPSLSAEIAEINDWFSYHAPDERQKYHLEDFRNEFRLLAEKLVVSVRNSRERAIALTELRKAAMCVNMAIIFDRS